MLDNINVRGTLRAPRTAAADYNPLILGREAPSNKRIQWTVAHASKLARSTATDPQLPLALGNNNENKINIQYLLE